jgi:hypothetical protein
MAYTGLALKHYLTRSPLREYGLIHRLTTRWRAYNRAGARLKLRDAVPAGEVVVFIQNR